MPHAFAWPALSLVAGIVAGIALGLPPWAGAVGVLLSLAAGGAALRRERAFGVLACVLAGWAAAGAALGALADGAARDPPLRRLLDLSDADRIVTLEGTLRQDAAPAPSGVSLALDVDRIVQSGRALSARGGVALTVLGAPPTVVSVEWRAGRRVRVPSRVREPTRYYGPGVPDHALSLARRGIVVVGSVKSAQLVEVLAPGGRVDEWAAGVRRAVRQRVREAVEPWSATSAGIVTAILIGDRAGLEEHVERDLQDAGTYHVIAISGGNIAILAGCLLLACRVACLPWRIGLVATAGVLVGYAQVAGGGSSVTRATTMAVVYLLARVIDQQTTPASALGLAAAVLLAASPLALVDPGFLLTFGATIAIVIAVPPILGSVAGAPAIVRAGAALLAASAAAEVALLPLGALFFSRITLAGLVLNFAAVPLMSVVQIGGMVAVAIAWVTPGAAATAGWVPHVAAQALIGSAALVHWMPAVTWRVPPPSLVVLALYYAALVAAVFARAWLPRVVPRHRLAKRLVIAMTCACGAWIGVAPPVQRLMMRRDLLRVSVLDVGQGDATIVQLPGGASVLVDAGGLGGPARFDIGERVVAPAMWALGIRRLTVLAVTHGDPDHLGGAAAILDAFSPREIWEGVPVPPHAPLRDLRQLADRSGAAWRTVQAGDVLDVGSVRLRVHHPPTPDWERQRVRNDDSIVLDVRYGDVSIVLPGDIGVLNEERVAPGIDPAPVRILKAAHHGSATSSGARFLERLAPRIAIVSCGRRNRFGHPARAVLERLERAGATVYRTDLQGTITVETDGKAVAVTPFLPLATVGEPAAVTADARRVTVYDAVRAWLEATQR